MNSEVMGRMNGNPETGPEEIDAEHELPPAEDGDEGGARVAATPAIPAEEAPLDAELRKVTAERDTLLDRMARMQAEFDNARKRASREQQEFRDFALADALKTMLPVLDSFDRALQASGDEKSEFRSGVELIYRQLQDALAKLGLRAIPAKGEAFDPRFHEAIATVDTEEVEDHHIVEELQRGYKLKERLLRPAMVKVARAPNS